MPNGSPLFCLRRPQAAAYARSVRQRHMDQNYDPRDETDVRPQVGFRLREGSYDYDEFVTALTNRFLSYHDILLFDPENGETPGVVRFKWDTPGAVVDGT